MFDLTHIVINSDTANFDLGNVAGGLTNPVQVTIPVS